MRTVKRNGKRVGFLAAISASAALLLGVAPAFAAPAWKIATASNSTAAPGSQVSYFVQIENVGDKSAPETAAGDETNCNPGAPAPPAVPGNCYTITATFPDGLQPIGGNAQGGGPSVENCTVDGASITCTASGSQEGQQVSPLNSPFATMRLVRFVAQVGSEAEGKVLTSSFEVSGAGAVSDSTVDATAIAAAPPEFGLAAFDIQATANAAGDVFTRAGGHPYELTSSIEFHTFTHPNPYKHELSLVEPVKDVVAELPPGLVADLSAAGRCTARELANGLASEVRSLCPPSSQVGAIYINYATGIDSTEQILFGPVPVFNMAPPPGTPARFGFNLLGTMVLLDAKLRSESDYGVSIVARNAPQGLAVFGTQLTFWGQPGAAAHDSQRACPGVQQPRSGGPTCAGNPGRAFLRLPTRCTAPGEGLPWSLNVGSWFNPGRFDQNGNPDMSDPAWDEISIRSHETPGFPRSPIASDPAMRGGWAQERGIENCEDVRVKGVLGARTTSIDTQTPSGLEVHVEVPNPGLPNPAGIASSDIKKVKVALPEGLTVNPSQAEGLGACSPAQLASTRLEFHPDGLHGCPSDSKIGSVNVKTPLLEEEIPGDVYIAQPYDNPFGSLLALYVVLHNEQRGILVKLPGKVTTDPVSGQITATFDDLPQVPFATFDFKFREGARAPLVTPQACGKYTTTAEFTGWSDPNGAPTVSTSSFEIVRGIGGSACPSGGLPPFKPGLLGGTRNNSAGSYSPFDLRLSRTDAEQEFTNFSIKLPPGLTAKLAGVPFCPEAAIAAAKDPNRSGAQELASPSCPAASEVGRILVGAGVGPVLTYVPGKIYLAGPYNGSAISVAVITAAKVGPFDLGTVVVREALRVNPETAEVFIDATGSDPIPHIIDGVTTHIRDIRAYVEKPNFALNPTSCAPTSIASTALGSGLDFFSEADNAPVTVTTRFQAANCASLGFKPKLALSLKGGTKRGQYPAFRAVLTARKGDANIGAAQVTLPHSAFLEQAHIRTICTRAQFKVGAVPGEKCPPASIYGYAKAITPLLDEPIEGPVFLRSSANPLPDLVAALHSGRIDVNLVGRIDSIKGGRIRNTFEAVPDAPVTKFTLTMQGGKKGLLVNSANLCKSTNRAIAAFTGHNGKIHDFNPVVKPQCKKAKKQKRRAR